jgi:hypothetical protein
MTITSHRNANGTWTTTIDEPAAPIASPITYSVVDKTSPVEKAAWKTAAAPTARETADAITARVRRADVDARDEDCDDGTAYSTDTD